MTISLSNLIKGGRIYYNNSDKVVIDSDSRKDTFRPLAFSRVEEKGSAALPDPSSDGDAPAPVSDGTATEAPDGYEASGQEELYAPALEEEHNQDESWENMVREKEALLADARGQAELILNQAREAADVIREEARQQGKSEGYEEGMAVAQTENEEAKVQIEQERRRLLDEYDELVAGLEPSVANLIASLVEKVTGVLGETTEGILAHLVHQALSPYADKDSFLVHAGPKDYAALAKKKEQLKENLPPDAQFHIIEDDSLGKNQCVLEIGDMMIDCSLDVELKNLLRDIRLLSIEP